jgi:potassium efflux system protein
VSARASLVAVMVLGAMLPTLTSAVAAERAPAISLDDARDQLKTIRKSVAAAQDERALLDLRAEVLNLQSELHATSNELAPQLAQLVARRAELDKAAASTNESSEVAAERAQLERQLTSVEGQATLAGVLSLEADQIIGQIAAQARERFRARLADRTNGPLERRFWQSLGTDAHRDAQRARTFAIETKDALVRVPALSVLAALLASVIAVVARRRLTARIQRATLPGRLQKSLRALAHVALNTTCVAIVATAFAWAVSSEPHPPPQLTSLLFELAAIAAGGVYVATLGAALLSARAPSWRLPRIPDRVASALRTFPLQLAVVIVLFAVIEQLTKAMSASLSMSVALEALMTLVLCATLAQGLHRGVRASQAEDGDASSAAKALHPWRTALVSIGWVVVGVAALCALTGYVALGSFVARQAAWVLIVLSSAYLLAVFVDDILTAVLPAPDAARNELRATAAITRTAVLLSALSRFTIALFALFLVVAPYAPGTLDFVPHWHRLQQGISIGTLELRPGAVARGILIFALGIGAVKMLKQWMSRRYLPVTDMDPGMRDSVTSLAGYAGYVVIISVALSSMGVGLQQIAWIASALALGIGFGLQAIVQNFVSGLILLAERPVKVGDRVVLEEFEGDVRRINARATEIQQVDRSTVIVPNSEFITKVVRNITFANPLGLVEIHLPVPLGSDVQRVRKELLQAFQDHPEILKTPEPSVMLEGIEDGNILFAAAGFVASPRHTYRVRSAILFEVLTRLNDAKIAMIRPTVLMRADKTGDGYDSARAES